MATDLVGPAVAGILECVRQRLTKPVALVTVAPGGSAAWDNICGTLRHGDPVLQDPSTAEGAEGSSVGEDVPVWESCAGVGLGQIWSFSDRGDRFVRDGEVCGVRSRPEHLHSDVQALSRLVGQGEGSGEVPVLAPSHRGEHLHEAFWELVLSNLSPREGAGPWP